MCTQNNLHITCIHFVSIVNIAHFTGPYLNWEQVIVLVYSWTWSHTFCLLSFFFILVITEHSTEQTKKAKRHSHAHPFSDQLNVTGGCIRQSRKQNSNSSREKNLPTLALFYSLDVIHFEFVIFFLFILCLFQVKIYKSFVFVVETNQHTHTYPHTVKENRNTCKCIVLFVLCFVVWCCAAGVHVCECVKEKERKIFK